jgi:hypothetical protein
MLELKKVRGRVAHDESLVHFDTTLETKADVGEEWHVALLTKLIELIKVALLAERDAEVPRVHGQLTHGHSLGRGLAEMTHQLVAEEVERYAVVVATSEFATQLGDVELDRLIEVVGRDGEVKDVVTLSHC